jgi:hypothetical protein
MSPVAFNRSLYPNYHRLTRAALLRAHRVFKRPARPALARGLGPEPVEVTVG